MNYSCTLYQNKGLTTTGSVLLMAQMHIINMTKKAPFSRMSKHLLFSHPDSTTSQNDTLWAARVNL